MPVTTASNARPIAPAIPTVARNHSRLITALFAAASVAARYAGDPGPL
ncbi:Uncharacterised protein [Mycobacteroides abscessus subsp. abscessus]|nr:Uncharacterised protein [Mycobacteroides abscessus subsp. abscessus]